MATSPKLKVEIITAERLVYEADQVDEVIVPGAEGELAILPRHAALITLLGSGELGHALTVRVHAVSDSAKNKIEANGGTVEMLPARATAS